MGLKINWVLALSWSCLLPRVGLWSSGLGLWSLAPGSLGLGLRP